MSSAAGDRPRSPESAVTSSFEDDALLVLSQTSDGGGASQAPQQQPGYYTHNSKRLELINQAISFINAKCPDRYADLEHNMVEVVPHHLWSSLFSPTEAYVCGVEDRCLPS